MSSGCAWGDTVAGDDEPAEQSEERMGLMQVIITFAATRRTFFAMRQATDNPRRQQRSVWQSLSVASLVTFENPTLFFFT